MKKYILILLAPLLIQTSLFSQCNEYFVFENGSEWEMEHFNSKDKMTGKSAVQVTDYNSSNDGFDAQVTSTQYDKKGKQVAKSDLSIKCEDGTILMDMRNFVAQEQLKMLESYEVTIQGDELQIPKTLEVGQTLPDGSMTINAEGPIPLKMIVEITDRKVSGKESVTTPAGTFDCFVISSHSYVKMGIAVNSDVKEYIAAGVGVVKSESYRNDKLGSYSILTKRK